MAGHALGVLHWTSHLHDSAQLMLAQASAPAQSTSQRFEPQLIPWHEPGPAHVMSQRSLAAQSMRAQAPMSLHVIVQSKPSGQVRSAHGLVVEHSTSQVLALRSHDVHGLGHAASRSTQKPATQVRGGSHSALRVHVNASERRVVKHPASITTPRAMASSIVTARRVMAIRGARS
jgi:hypothetical protein